LLLLLLFALESSRQARFVDNPFSHSRGSLSPIIINAGM
jgi:hypothetical protein